jgi:hypothetical protein
VTNAIADVLPMHGEAVRRASGFVLVAKGRVISHEWAWSIATTPLAEIRRRLGKPPGGYLCIR